MEPVSLRHTETGHEELIRRHGDGFADTRN